MSCRMMSTVSLVCVGLAALLSIVSGAEPSQTQSPDRTQDIPMEYRILCGSAKAGWLKDPCDGRSQYCHLTGVAKCGSCARICMPTQSTSECQGSCKMYLTYEHETAKERALNNKLDLLDKAGKTERSRFEERLDNVARWNIGLTLCVVVTGVLLMVALGLLVYVTINVKDHNRSRYGPLCQDLDAPVADKKDAESGFGTTDNTAHNSAESLRRASGDAPGEVGNEARPGDGGEALNEDDNAAPAQDMVPPPWNVVVHPSDAPRGVPEQGRP